MATPAIPAGFKLVPDTYGPEIIPQAQGKAAALSAWLARGGTPFRYSGRFKKGPMKGLNVDEATAQFERMWAAAPDSVKQKYANRTSGPMTDLAPSERQIPGMTPTPKQGTPQTRRMASYGHEFKPDGSVGRIGEPARQVKPDSGVPGTSKIVAGPPSPGNAEPQTQGQNAMAKPLVNASTASQVAAPDLHGAESADDQAARLAGGIQGKPAEADRMAREMSSQPVPGSDEARRIAFDQNVGNGLYEVADTGDGAMRAAVAMRDKTVNPNATTGAGRGESILAPGTDISKLRPVSAPQETTPIDRAITGVLDANTRFWDRTTKAVNSAIAAPFTPDSERIVGAESEAARRTLEAKRAAEAEAQQRRMVEENANRLRREQGLPVPAVGNTPSTAAPATSPVATQPPAPATNPPTPKIPSMQPAPTGAPVIPREFIKQKDGQTYPIQVAVDDANQGQVRINHLAGLPFGYLPGDKLPSGADAAMQGRAMDSVVRQDFGAGQVATPAQQAGAQRMMERDGATPRIAGMRPTPMPRGPASRPVRTGSSLDNPSNAFSKAAYARTDAAIARGEQRQEQLRRAKNIDDPKKFFTGRTLPLDQLVKNQKLRGIGTPALAR